MQSKLNILPILLLLLLSLPVNALNLFTNSGPATEARTFIESEKNTISVFQNNVNSVVNITNIRKVRMRGGWFDHNATEVPAGMGSGFVWDKKGHIVTNYHVVADGDSFIVTFNKDKNQYKAKLVGAEPRKDIAVLKIEKLPPNVNPINIGESKSVIPGQKAMAIGSPFGLDSTITAGIVSATERKIQGIGGVTIHGMIQTDCAINRGNSGGPLIDSQGKLIGMNTMIYSTTGASAGIGFALPVETIKRIAPQLIQFGKIIRPGLGIALMSDDFKEAFNIEKGIVIRSVPEGTAAAKAGLKGLERDRRGRFKVGDIITSVDEKEVNSYDDIYHTLEKYSVGDEVKVKYLREGKYLTVKLKLQEISYE